MCKFELVLQELINQLFHKVYKEVRTSASPMNNNLKGGGVMGHTSAGLTWPVKTHAGA